MAILTVTPEVFFDLFVLCLSWQWWPENYASTFTTVDKVVRILFGMGILTESQRRNLFKDRRTQSLFLRRSRIMNSGSPLSTAKLEVKNRYGRLERQETFLDQPEPLVLALPIGVEINRLRLLRDYRWHLTFRGKTYADSIASKYASILIQEAYYAEIDRQGHPDDRSMGPIMQKYRMRVTDETESR